MTLIGTIYESCFCTIESRTIFDLIIKLCSTSIVPVISGGIIHLWINMYVLDQSVVSVCLGWDVCIYSVAPPWAGCDTRSVFEQSKDGLSWIIHLNRLLYLSKRTQSTHSWGKKGWIHAFPKGTSMMWNTNSLLQDLKLGWWFYFQRWSYLPNPSARAGYDTRSIFFF